MKKSLHRMILSRDGLGHRSMLLSNRSLPYRQEQSPYLLQAIQVLHEMLLELQVSQIKHSYLGIVFEQVSQQTIDKDLHRC